MNLLESPVELAQYDARVKSHPHGTLWQSLEWKQYQEALGREVRIYREEESSALVIIDRTTMGLSTWDIPRGPLQIENGKLKIENILSEIAREAEQDKCLSLYFSPQIEKSIFNFPFSIFNSRRSEQPPATRLIDLQGSEEEILAQMKQKGRYNIRVAEKHGVQIQQSKDIDSFARLAAETARRDGFTAPPASRYKTFLESLPGAFLLLAYPTPNAQPPTPIAGLLGTQWNGTGIYYYGASDYAYRNLMAPYLLQWEAMKLCKTAGCHTYDLLGISRPTPLDLTTCLPDRQAHHPPSTTLDSWSGITRFKEQFGGRVVEYPPEQQIILKPMAWKLLQLKRKFL